MSLGMELGLGRRLCVIWGPRSLSQKGGVAPPPIFCTYLLWPNGLMDEACTWHGGRPELRRLCVRWGPSPIFKKGAEPPPQFSAHFYCGQTAGCIKMPLGIDVGLSSGDFVLDGDPAPPFHKGVEPTPQFSSISIVAKRLDATDASRCHLV